MQKLWKFEYFNQQNKNSNFLGYIATFGCDMWKYKQGDMEVTRITMVISGIDTWHVVEIMWHEISKLLDQWECATWLNQRSPRHTPCLVKMDFKK